MDNFVVWQSDEDDEEDDVSMAWKMALDKVAEGVALLGLGA